MRGDAQLDPTVQRRLLETMTPPASPGRGRDPGRPEATARRSDPAGDRGPASHRPGRLQRRDLRRPVHQRGHGQDPHQQSLRQDRRPRPRPGGHLRLSPRHRRHLRPAGLRGTRRTSPRIDHDGPDTDIRKAPVELSSTRALVTWPYLSRSGARRSAGAPGPRPGSARRPCRCAAPSHRRGASCTARCAAAQAGSASSWPAGRPHRGQSHSSGTAASLAKLGRVSCMFAHQNGTRTRGAASPRSASPIGPAPTRLPRIALPLPTDELLARWPRRSVRMRGG